MALNGMYEALKTKFPRALVMGLRNVGGKIYGYGVLIPGEPGEYREFDEKGYLVIDKILCPASSN